MLFYVPAERIPRLPNGEIDPFVLLDHTGNRARHLLIGDGQFQHFMILAPASICNLFGRNLLKINQGAGIIFYGQILRTYIRNMYIPIRMEPIVENLFFYIHTIHKHRYVLVHEYCVIDSIPIKVHQPHFAGFWPIHMILDQIRHRSAVVNDITVRGKFVSLCSFIILRPYGID